MRQIKICPDCSTEYFAHIEKCADCGTKLILPEENIKLQEERQRLKEKEIENQVIIRSGDLNWMDELLNVLIGSGINSFLSSDPGCKKSCSGDAYYLVVSSKDAHRANELIEEHFMKVHPELKASNELMNDGKCPACGTSVSHTATECPECGLTLMIIE